MAEKRRTAVDPVIPEINTCPRCGEYILLGDVVCSNCGYGVQSTTDRLRSQPAIVVTVGAFVIGTMIAAAATGMDNPWKFVALLIGFGFIVGGSLYYAADLLVLNKHNRRRKLD
jgi:ribosomal protein L32